MDKKEQEVPPPAQTANKATTAPMLKKQSVLLATTAPLAPKVRPAVLLRLTTRARSRPAPQPVLPAL